MSEALSFSKRPFNVRVQVKLRDKTFPPAPSSISEWVLAEVAAFPDRDVAIAADGGDDFYKEEQVLNLVVDGITTKSLRYLPDTVLARESYGAKLCANPQNASYLFSEIHLCCHDVAKQVSGEHEPDASTQALPLLKVNLIHDCWENPLEKLAE
jgi:hypothetical protein